VRELFQLGRENKPAIIFVDEIDSLCSSRSEQESESARRVKTEFLVQMNGVGNAMDGVLILAATNLPWSLDPAIRRRFEKRIYIPLPGAGARSKMFQVHLGDTPHNLSVDDFQELAELTDGYSGSDVAVVVREALMMPVRMVQGATHFKRVMSPDRKNKDVLVSFWTPCSPGDPEAQGMTWIDIKGEELLEPMVTKRHFKQSIVSTKPTVNKADLERYETWTKSFGQEG